MFFFDGPELRVASLGSPGTSELLNDEASFAGNLFASFGDSVLYTAFSRNGGVGQLWISDGTPEGTKILQSDFQRTSTLPRRVGPQEEFLTFQGRLYFRAIIDDQPGLWATDGTEEGTMPIDLGGAIDPRGQQVLGDRLYFVVDIDGRREIRFIESAVDPEANVQTAAEIAFAEAFALSATLEGQLVVASGSTLYSLDPVSGELQQQEFSFDILGMEPLRDGLVLFGQEPPRPEVRDLRGMLAFTDLSADGTREFEVPYVGFPFATSTDGERLFYITIGDGDTIWGTDGTPEGTRELVSDTATFDVPRSRPPRLHVTEDGQLFFTATTLTAGEELFAIDTRHPSDINGDGTVNFPDFLALSANFGMVDAAFEDGDLDGDGMVGFLDFLQLSRDFGQR